MTFIKNEIKYIIDKLSTNPNKNILYHSKYTKFTIDKYDNSHLKNDVNIFPSNNINIIIKNDITNKWLVNKGENCRYCSFITMSKSFTFILIILWDSFLHISNIYNE